MEYYTLNNNENKNLEIKIKGIENIANMSFMFFECSALINLSGLNANIINNKSYMLYGYWFIRKFTRHI